MGDARPNDEHWIRGMCTAFPAWCAWCYPWLHASLCHCPSPAARAKQPRSCGERPTCCLWTRLGAAPQRPESAGQPRSACRCALATTCSNGIKQALVCACACFHQARCVFFISSLLFQHAAGLASPPTPLPRLAGRHPPRVYRRHLPATAGCRQGRRSRHTRACLQVGGLGGWACIG